MNSDYFIGVDIGTTSTKAIVFSTAGAVKGTGNYEYPLLVPQPAWAEQDPDAIFRAVIAAVRHAIDQSGLDKSAIAALCFSGAMHSLIALDAKGYPLTRSIIWADNRSAPQTERLKQGGVGQALYSRTGTPIHPMLPLTKLMWMQEEAADTFQQASRFVSIKEYVLYQLLDRFVVDHSIASATGLLNLEQLQWDQEALTIAAIGEDSLSELVPTTEVLQGLKPHYAEAMGVSPDVAIVVGATDGVLANLGVGAIAPQQVAITIGTSSAVRTVVSQPTTDPKGRTFCYALTQDRWVIGGSSNNGGVVLRWLQEQFCQPEVALAKERGVDPYELMIEAATHIAPGAEGLLCLPFLSGERAPHWNTDARGVFFGMELHHTRSHFIRAVLEGILFAVYSIDLVLRELSGTEKEICASGGFVRSEPWLQMMADIFGYPVLVPEVYEASAFGAAVLGMHAVGTIADLAEVESLIRITHRRLPNDRLSSTYQPLFSFYERLYHSVAEEYKDLAAYQRHGDQLGEPTAKESAEIISC